MRYISNAASSQRKTFEKKKNKNKENSCKYKSGTDSKPDLKYIQQQRKEVERIMQWYIHFQPEREKEREKKCFSNAKSLAQ